MTKQDVEGARLAGLLKLSQTPSSMERYRLFCYSSAAVLLVIVVQLLQATAVSVSLQIALVAASVGMPLFIMQAYVLEMYLALGEESYAHAMYALQRPFSIAIQGVALLSLLAAVTAVLYHLLPIAAYVLITCTLFAMIVGAFAQQSLGSWWFSDWGPKRKYGSVTKATTDLVKDWIASGKVK